MNRHASRLVVALDLASLTIAIVISSWITLDAVLPWNSTIALESPIPMIVTLYVGALLGELVARQLWKISVQRPSYVRAVMVLATTIGVVAIGALFTRFYWSRSFLAVTAITWFVLMVLYRAIWRSRPWEERYVVISANKELADDLASSPHADVIEIVAPDADTVTTSPDPGASVLIESHVVYSDAVSGFIRDAREQGMPVRDFDDVYEEHTGKVSIVRKLDGWSAPMSIHPRSGYLPIKRGLDIAGAIVLAPIAIPVSLGAMAWVKADGGGPVMFHQERVGRDGKRITIHKIRTMQPATSGPAATAADEGDRITKPGAFLRRWRIDELPQLWNVVKGDLSLVGPRPEQVPLAREYARQIPFYPERHLVRPGLTGWAQVHHGYASGVEETIEKLGYDLFSIKHMSIWLDLRVVGRSVWTVVSGFGAK